MQSWNINLFLYMLISRLRTWGTLMRPVSKWAIIFGVLFILLGISGFIPAFKTDGYLLFGYFAVGTKHNIFYIISGVLAFLAYTDVNLSQLYFKAVCVVYGTITILGLVLGGNLMFMQVNISDTILHLAIAVVALFIGFYMEAED